MKPTWGFVAALTMMCGALYLFGYAMHVQRWRDDSQIKYLTQEEIDQELKWWRDERAGLHSSNF